MDGWFEMAEMFLLLEFDLSTMMKMFDLHHLSSLLVYLLSLLVEMGFR